MPVFEFVCQDCRHAFEELVPSATQARRTECPSCHSRKTTRKLSLFAARSGMTRRAPAATAPTGCARCGDPNGPCGL